MFLDSTGSVLVLCVWRIHVNMVGRRFMLKCLRYKMCISCCLVVRFGLVVEVFISLEQHSSAPSATPGLLGVMALPWALPWRLSSSDVRTGCQPGRRSVDLCLGSLDDEPSLLTVTDLLRMSTASTWWRTRITLRCHCEQALLLRYHPPTMDLTFLW